MNAEQLYLKLMKDIKNARSIPPCQTTDPELWYGIPERDGFTQSSNYKPAKQLCSQCPVKNSCLEYALVAGETQGVWGGLSPDERKQMRSKHRKKTYFSARSSSMSGDS